MRKQGFIIILAVVFGMIYFYFQDHEPSFKKSNTILGSGPAESEASNPQTAPQEQFVAPSSDVPAEVTVESNAAGDSTEVQTQKAFAQHLKMMSQCLQIKNQADQDQVDPVVDRLVDSLKPVFGDVAVFTDDWTQTDLKYSDGISRRIRTEINYENQSNPIKYLYVYKLNDQGLPELENINEQQSQNPSDEYIASLEAGSNIVLKEKGGRAYFTGGEELIIIERNSKLESFTITKNNKTFSCNSMTNSESNCQCF